MSAKKTIVALGDSLTYSGNLGVTPAEFWPAIVQKNLKALGCNVQVRNMGRSGWSSGQILQAVNVSWAWEIPSLAIILLGSNDFSACTVQASPSPTVTSCTVTTGRGAFMPPGTRFTINGNPVTVLTQVGDTLTFPATTLPVAGQAATIDTAANLTLIGQALVAAGVPLIMYVAKPYQNLATNADTVGAENAIMAQIRAAQTAAAVAMNAPITNMYQFMRERIVAGLDVQGSASWHVYQDNTHHNAYGESIIGIGVSATIQAQSGWINALT